MKEVDDLVSWIELDSAGRGMFANNLYSSNHLHEGEMGTVDKTLGTKGIEVIEGAILEGINLKDKESFG
jgi:cytoskeletal protein CcmA (bactofilin family)